MKITALFSLMTALLLLTAFTGGKIPDDYPDLSAKPSGHPQKLCDTNYMTPAGDSVLRWIATFETQYDEQGNVITHAAYSEKGKLLYLDSPAHDRFGHRLDICYHIGASYKLHVADKIFLHYDSAGRKTSNTAYFADGKVDRRAVYDYGSQPYCITKKIYNKDSALIELHSYAWDQRGNCILDSGFTVWARNWKTTYRYDALDLPVEEAVYKNDTLIRRDVTTFDAHRNAISTERFLGNGERDTFTLPVSHYLYDQYGNWTERKDTYRGKVLGYYMKHEISYYK